MPTTGAASPTHGITCAQNPILAFCLRVRVAPQTSSVSSSEQYLAASVYTGNHRIVHVAV
eukprot:29404-Pelagococcus_subviridis.AAC.1